MRLRKKIYRGSLFVPVIAACWLFLEPFGIYISEINLYLWDRLLLPCFLIFIAAWSNFSPYRNGCKDGSVFELLFNFFPVEILYTLVFAQYHFFLTLILFLIIAALSLAFRYSLRKDEAGGESGRRRHARNLMSAHRFFVFVTAVLLAVPSILAVLAYGLKSPVYEAKESLVDEILAADETEISSDSEADDSMEFINCFDEDAWSSFSIEEKITVLQMLADYEFDYLGMPAVPLSSGQINIFILGEYDSLDNTINIDIKNLEDSAAKDAMVTLLHELYHAYQNYVISSIDWDSEFAGSAYFAEAREWKDNDEKYITPDMDYDGYENQPMEASAREFSETESSRLLSLAGAADS